MVDKIKAILEKLIVVLQKVAEYVAIAIEVIGKIIAWLAEILGAGVRKVFGIKK
jgi:hypothetical protein